jgi:hypothetical protein
VEGDGWREMGGGRWVEGDGWLPEAETEAAFVLALALALGSFPTTSVSHNLRSEGWRGWDRVCVARLGWEASARRALPGLSLSDAAPRPHTLRSRRL